MSQEQTASRTSKALRDEINNKRDALINRFEAISQLASAERNDRNAAANLQLQMQVETSMLISAAEDLQKLIRRMQEMWLFGPLNTIGDSKVQQQTDEDATAVAGLLAKLVETQQGSDIEGDGHDQTNLPSNL